MKNVKTFLAPIFLDPWHFSLLKSKLNGRKKQLFHIMRLFSHWLCTVTKDKDTAPGMTLFNAWWCMTLEKEPFQIGLSGCWKGKKVALSNCCTSNSGSGKSEMFSPSHSAQMKRNARIALFRGKDCHFQIFNPKAEQFFMYLKTIINFYCEYYFSYIYY